MSKFIKKKEVLFRCSISSSTLYRLIEKNEFPAGVRISARAIAWVEQEVDEWIADKIQSRSN